jgi:hypothetical protein
VQGQLSEAMGLYESAVAGYHRAGLDDDHPEVLTCMSWQGVVLAAQGKLVEALELQERVLRGRRARLGDDHPLTRSTSSTVAELQQQTRSSAVTANWEAQAAVAGEEH